MNVLSSKHMLDETVKYVCQWRSTNANVDHSQKQGIRSLIQDVWVRMDGLG